jgi:hypothetical protein
MRAEKLQGPCIAYKTVANMRYRSITELGLNKARASKINTSNLKLGDILCHKCYMKLVEWDRYEKQKSKGGKQFSNSIDELAESYNKRLEMTGDIQDESEISEELVEEDETSQLEDIPAYKQLNQKFHELLIGIFKFSRSYYKNSILILKCIKMYN